MINIPLYVAFLYFCFSGLRQSKKDTIMYAVLVFGLQFLLMQYVPGIQGYQGWLLFAFILGRFIGVQHPASEIERPLDAKRIVLGWITLLIFALCFSPAPVVIQ